MNPNTKLLLVGALLIAALAFYFLGEGLLDTAEAPLDMTPTPQAFLRLLHG